MGTVFVLNMCTKAFSLSFIDISTSRTHIEWLRMLTYLPLQPVSQLLTLYVRIVCYFSCCSCGVLQPHVYITDPLVPERNKPSSKAVASNTNRLRTLQPKVPGGRRKSRHRKRKRAEAKRAQVEANDALAAGIYRLIALHSPITRTHHTHSSHSLITLIHRTRSSDSLTADRQRQLEQLQQAGVRRGKQWCKGRAETSQSSAILAASGTHQLIASHSLITYTHCTPASHSLRTPYSSHSLITLTHRPHSSGSFTAEHERQLEQLRHASIRVVQQRRKDREETSQSTATLAASGTYPLIL
jgi:hypothetical protein